MTNDEIRTYHNKTEQDRLFQIKTLVETLETSDELRAVSSFVKSKRDFIAKNTKVKLKNGDKVTINGSNRIFSGVIQKVNITRALVLADDGGLYNVPFIMLEVNNG
jgi:ribosomal protein S17